MGANLSTSQTSDVKSIVRKSVNTSVDKQKSSINSNDINNQRIEWNTDGANNFDGCDIDASESESVHILAKATQDNGQQMRREIEDSLMSDVDKRIEESNSGLNLLQFNASGDRNLFESRVRSATRNSVMSAINKSISVEGDNNQTIIFNSKTGNTCKNSKIKLNHISETVISDIGDQLSTQILEDKEIEKIANKYKLTATLSNKGIDPTMIIMAVIALIVVIIAARYIMKK